MAVGRRHVAGVVTAVICIALALPAAALAGKGGKCNASACKVYIEQGVGKPGGPGSQGPQGPQKPTGGSSTGGTVSQQTVVPNRVARVLAHAGQDKAPLSHLLTDAGLGPVKSAAGRVGSPSALGAAFDLGSGPTVLLALLLGTAIGFGIHGGLRNWRRRRAAA
jgi:hypothetical protein